MSYIHSQVRFGQGRACFRLKDSSSHAHDSNARSLKPPEAIEPGGQLQPVGEARPGLTRVHRKVLAEPELPQADHARIAAVAEAADAHPHGLATVFPRAIARRLT